MPNYAVVNMESGDPCEGYYLSSFDPDYRPDGKAVYPCGLVEWTRDPDEAITYPDPGQALALWRQPSTRVPYRPDGQPNRPLSAVTVEIRDLDQGTRTMEGHPLPEGGA